MAGGATCIAYETVTDTDDGLPLLARMSQAVGRMAIQADHNTSKPSTAAPISDLGESRRPISQDAHQRSRRCWRTRHRDDGETRCECDRPRQHHHCARPHFAPLRKRPRGATRNASDKVAEVLEAPTTDPLHPSRERSLHMGMLSSFDGVRMSMPLQPRPRQSVRREFQSPHAWTCHGSQAASPQEAEFLADRVQPATAPRSSLRRFRR